MKLKQLEKEINTIVNNKQLRQFSPEVGESRRLANKHGYDFFYVANGAFELKKRTL